MSTIGRPNSEFVFSDNFIINEDVKRAFDINGYIIVRGLLDPEESGLLKTALQNDEGIMKNHYGRDDGSGMRTKTVLWNQPGNDITGVIARSEKIAGTFEELLGGEVYHYHSKVIMKEAHTGGAHVWHQDYGYWYQNACMFPNMGTVWVAVDKATKQNGCVQLMAGSHLMGRVDHHRIGEQVQADLSRVKLADQVCPLVYAEMEPGDALFFHCNVLHRSDQNRSDNRRWAFLVAFNRADNNPLLKHHHPQYTPLCKVPNGRIRESGTVTDMSGKDFFQGPKDDISLQKVATKNKDKV